MPDRYVCSKCGRGFDTKRGLSSHERQAHPQEDGFLSWEPELSLSKRQLVVLVFAIGALAGYGAASVDIAGLLPDEPARVSVTQIDNSGDPVLGQKDAEVTMVLYEDFQCPFCRRFEQRAMPRIEQEYIDTGQVKVVWKDFPLARIHPWAVRGAEVMECVYRQDSQAFWSVKNTVFDSQQQVNQDNVEDRITGWASEEGVNASQVRSCLQTGNPMAEVVEDVNEGRSYNATVAGDSFVTGTPSAVIYREGDSTGIPIVGAQPYSVFREAIESKLEG